MLRRDLLENLPNVPKRGLLRRLILQAPENNFKDWLTDAILREDIVVPIEFWDMIESFDSDIEKNIVFTKAWEALGKGR